MEDIAASGCLDGFHARRRHVTYLRTLAGCEEVIAAIFATCDRRAGPGAPAMQFLHDPAGLGQAGVGGSKVEWDQ
jgi:hypothetical protein